MNWVYHISFHFFRTNPINEVKLFMLIQLKQISSNIWILSNQNVLYCFNKDVNKANICENNVTKTPDLNKNKSLICEIILNR